jgi:hypothetical protein
MRGPRAKKQSKSPSTNGPSADDKPTAQTPATKSGSAPSPGPRSRPTRSTTLPPAPTDRTLDYAKCRDELKGIEPGEVVLAIEATHAWQQVMVPLLDDVDARRRAPRPGEAKRRGRPSQYSAHDFERMELLRRVLGLTSTKATRDWLTTDRACPTRAMFGLNRVRPHFGGKVRKLMEGIPSDGTMSDYRVNWFGEADRAAAYQLLERFLLIEKLMASPDGAAELDVLYADGSKLETHYTPPKMRKGEICNAELRPDSHGHLRSPITAPDAGFIPNTGGNADHSGAGWNIVFISTIRGTIVTRRCPPLNASESGTLTDMVEELGEVLSSFERRLRVMTTDGAFNSQALRAKLHDIGVVDNIHLSSHSTKASKSLKSVAQRDRKRYAIEGSRTWEADGHRQLHCKCGKGKTVRRVRVNAAGRAIVATQGECKHGCGTVRVQAGLWRLAKNPDRFVRCRPGEQDNADWTFGNPLTFHDEVAKSYGVPRYNAQEGMFGSQFTTRFSLLKNKRWFRRQTQVELEVSMVISITHGLSLMRYERMPAAAASPPGPGGAPPPLAAAA